MPGDTLRVTSGIGITNRLRPLQHLTIGPDKSHIGVQARHQGIHIPVVNGPTHLNNQGVDGLLVRSSKQKSRSLWHALVHTKSAKSGVELAHSDSTCATDSGCSMGAM